MPVTILNTGTFNGSAVSATAGLASASAAGNAPSASTGNSILQPPAGYALFGAYPGSSSDTTLAGYEAANMAGRKLATWYRYYSIYDEPAYPTANDISLATAGRTLMAFLTPSFAVPPAASSYTYAQINSGALDTQINSIGARMALMPGPVFVPYQAEMDLAARSGYGSAADFILSFRRVASMLRAAAPGNVVMMFVTCHANSAAAAYYPGDAYADWIGFDPYDVAVPSTSPSAIYAPYFAWVNSDPFSASGGAGSGGAHGKPIAIPETGVVQAASGSANDIQNAAWINAVPGVLAGWTSTWGSQVQLWQWFNSSGGAGNTALIPGSNAATAMKNIGAASFFNP